MALLEIKNLSFRYDQQKFDILRDINMLIEPKTVNVLIGPNGCGKSTLLKIILGLEKGTGEVLFNYPDQNNYQVGYLPQRFQTDRFSPITVEEFLNLALSTCKHTASEKQAMIRLALKEVEAVQIRNEKLRNLSGGQLQRALLARAIVHRPNLLILDEPETAVDPGGERVFYQLIKKLVSKRKVTVLMASHEITLVREYADCVFCLNRTIVCEGKPQAVLTGENLTHLYGEEVKEIRHQH